MLLQKDKKLQQFSVMIIDDDALVQKLVSDVLLMLGFGKVYHAENAKVALEFLNNTTVDFIICDWRMPELNGIEFIQLVRRAATNINPLIPIIILTGNAEAHHVLEARDAGASEYLVKPFTVKQLCARIMEVVEKPREFVVADTFKGPSRRRKEMPIKTTERRKRNVKPVKVGHGKK